jgi:hypothetical protein
MAPISWQVDSLRGRITMVLSLGLKRERAKIAAKIILRRQFLRIPLQIQTLFWSDPYDPDRKRSLCRRTLGLNHSANTVIDTPIGCRKWNQKVICNCGSDKRARVHKMLFSPGVFMYDVLQKSSSTSAPEYL